MPSKEIDYQELLRRGLLSVVREALAWAVEEGLPGEHHFYLTFRTDHPEAELPPELRRRFPEEMTIVLQHQFWNLRVEEEHFRVTLRFDGARKELMVPFAALVAFADPAAEFGLRFREMEEGDGEAEEGDAVRGEPGVVVSLDEFRKR